MVARSSDLNLSSLLIPRDRNWLISLILAKDSNLFCYTNLARIASVAKSMGIFMDRIQLLSNVVINEFRYGIRTGGHQFKPCYPAVLDCLCTMFTVKEHH